MPLRVCSVSFTSPSGVRHSVDVEAETLYVAAGLGLARLKASGWVEGLGPGDEVRDPRSGSRATSHVITVERLKRWVNGVTVSPAETLRRAKVKALIT
jgi:hypothetical protein